MRPIFSKCLACSLVLCLLAPSLSAETPAAMLYSTGNFALNGADGPRSSAIMPGDQIQTRAGASVSITSTGTNVLVGPNSSLTYDTGAIQFADGTAVVATSRSMAAEVRGVRVTPAKAAGTYRISRDGNRVIIAALKGSLVLSEGSESHTLAEGRSAMMPEPIPQAVPGAQQPAGGTPSKKVGIVLGAIALGTTTALIFTQIGDDEKPVSQILP